MDPNPSELTRLLSRAREDRGSALEALMPLVYAELRRVAAGQLRRERGDHTLQPTALANEAYLRLADQEGLTWEDRAQFLAVAAHVMRQILVDHARTKRAEKRGGGRARVTLQEELIEGDAAQVDVLDLHGALEVFAARDERRAKVVEMRFFGGLTFEETAHVLGIAPKTVEADWYLARAWLRREMRAGRDRDETP